MSTAQRLSQHVEYLCGIQPPRNYLEKQSLKKASGYIHQQMQEAGLSPEYQYYTLADGHQFRNVVARLGEPTLPTVVVGAHYDVCETTPGADDNASAVAVLLEVARGLAAAPPQNFCFEFVSYCNEEPPHFGREEMGSYHHAQAMAKSKRDLRLMVCLEMVGYFSDIPESQELPLGLEMLIPEGYPKPGPIGNFLVLVGISKFADAVLNFAQGLTSNKALPIYPVVFPDATNLAYLSDHINYWAFGYPALMVNDTSFLRNHHYHALSDLPETLDYHRMALLTERLQKRLSAEIEA